MKDTKKKRRIFIALLLIFLVIGLTALLFPFMRRLSNPQELEAFQARVAQIGIAGPLAVLGIQILQIIIAFIPGEPVELLAGALYGALPGLLICLTGCVLASTVIFLLSKRFGKRFLTHFFSQEKIDTWRWLQDNEKIDLVVFLLFLIPGTPKDMLTYVVGITDMKVSKFIGLSTFARIPSVLSSTMIGSAMWQGQWKISLIVLLLTGALGVAGILSKQRVLTFCRSFTRHHTAGPKNQSPDVQDPARHEK